MKNISLTIENNTLHGYKSQYVADVLDTNKLKASGLIVVNLYEDINLIQIKLVASGFLKYDFLLEIRNGNLFLYAERTEKLSEKQAKFCSMDVDTFSKSFIIPANVIMSKIKAHFADGKLIIDLPKRKFFSNIL
jgi:HSP20 family molecular chaperone IbpA